LMARSSSAYACCAAASSLVWVGANATHEASAGLSCAMANRVLTDVFCSWQLLFLAAHVAVALLTV
jgi:hypothetical protein